MIHVEEIEACLADEAALAKLLTSIPLPQSVRPLLRKPFFGRKWNAAQQLDHWFASDGKTVVCVKISGASASITLRMRMRFDDLRNTSAGLQPSRKIVRGLLAVIAREDAKVSAALLDARPRS